MVDLYGEKNTHKRRGWPKNNNKKKLIQHWIPHPWSLYACTIQGGSTPKLIAEDVHSSNTFWHVQRRGMISSSWILSNLANQLISEFCLYWKRGSYWKLSVSKHVMGQFSPVSVHMMNNISKSMCTSRINGKEHKPLVFQQPCCEILRNVLGSVKKNLAGTESSYIVRSCTQRCNIKPCCTRRETINKKHCRGFWERPRLRSLEEYL